MTINARVQTALAGVGCPVAFAHLPQELFNDFPRITYLCTLEQDEYWADNVAAAHVYSVQVDVWHKTDYSALVENVSSAMAAAGFGRGVGQDYFETDAGVYHKLLRFTHTEVLM